MNAPSDFFDPATDLSAILAKEVITGFHDAEKLNPIWATEHYVVTRSGKGWSETPITHTEVRNERASAR